MQIFIICKIIAIIGIILLILHILHNSTTTDDCKEGHQVQLPYNYVENNLINFIR